MFLCIIYTRLETTIYPIFFLYFSRGYAEAEIEAVFAKYDLDGDRCLNESEQRKMQLDLEQQKQNLERDIDFENNRPKSAHSTMDSDEEDEDSGTKSSRGSRVVNGVSYEEFTVLSRRVDRMEHSIGSIVSKIDAVLVKLEAMERAKSKRRETMSKILDSITEVTNHSNLKLFSHQAKTNTKAMSRLLSLKWVTLISVTIFTPSKAKHETKKSLLSRSLLLGVNVPLTVKAINTQMDVCYTVPTFT